MLSLPPTARLRFAAGVTARREHAGVMVRGGGVEVDCGPDGFVLLDLIQDDATPADISTALGTRLKTRARWMRAMTALAALWQSGLLVEIDAAAPAAPSGFAKADIHVAMLNDTIRTTAFINALRSVIRPDDVVVDIGTGTGVLAVAAALAGARRVFGIEVTAMADVARAVAVANGVADRVTILRGWSHRVELPERARILVSETLGHKPWTEHIQASMLDARRRFGTPDVIAIPARVRVLAQPVALPPGEVRRSQFCPEDVARWSSLYEMDLTALSESRLATAGPLSTPADAARLWSSLAPPSVVDTVDLLADGTPAAHATATFTATHAGEVSGVMVSWEADLTDDISISTHPTAAGPQAHWRVLSLPVLPPLAVRDGERFRLDIPLAGDGHVTVPPEGR